MRIISTTWLARVRCGVRSAESPTVPIAEEASYIRFRNSACGSKIDMAATAVSQNVKVIIVIVSADRMLSIASFRPKHSVSLCPLRTEMTVRATSAKVVVLIPPAVPAGEPPINIRIQPSSRELSVSPDWDTDANPAVRVVTDWNAEASTFSGTLKSAMVSGLLNSSRKYPSVPPRIRTAVMTRTILLWSPSLVKILRFAPLSPAPFFAVTKMSCHTGNPRPPITIKNMVVRLTSGESTYCIKLVEPMMSIPALQKPEME